MQRLFGAVMIAATLALSGAGPALAELRKPEIYSDFEGKAIKGYDVVGYFTENAAIKGTPEFTHQWKDTTWYFASAEHRDLFAANPEAYAPQFGGYCAWAILHDRLVHVDPEIFKITGGKLYLNLNMKAHNDWLDGMQKHINQANLKWPEVLVYAK